MAAAGGPGNHQEVASVPWRHHGPCWAWCQSLSGILEFFLWSVLALQKGSAVGYLGPARSRSGDEKSCCLAALPAPSSSESFPCLFTFGIYLFTTEVSAQSRLAVPNSPGGPVAAASSVKVPQCWECFHPKPRGSEAGFLREQCHRNLPSNACLALGNERGSTG